MPNIFTGQAAQGCFVISLHFTYPGTVFRKLFLTVSLLLSAFGLHAQLSLPKPEEVKLARSLPLLVLFEEENPMILARLKNKPDLLQAYRQDIVTNNERLQRLAPKYWTFSSDIRLQSQPDQKTSLNSRAGKYCILSYKGLLGQHKQRELTNRSNDLTNSNAIQYAYYMIEYERAITLELVEEGNSNKLAVKQLTKMSTEGDIILTLKTIQQYLLDIEQGKKMRQMAMDAKQRGVRLQQKTLLLAQEDLQPGLTPADIDALYPFPHQVVSRSVVDSAIVTAAPQYACVRQMPVNTQYESHTVQIVVSVEDGMELAYSKQDPIDIQLKNTSVVDPLVVKKESLKDFARYAGGKIMLAVWPPY